MAKEQKEEKKEVVSDKSCRDIRWEKLSESKKKEIKGE